MCYFPDMLFTLVHVYHSLFTQYGGIDFFVLPRSFVFLRILFELWFEIKLYSSSSSSNHNNNNHNNNNNNNIIIILLLLLLLIY